MTDKRYLILYFFELELKLHNFLFFKDLLKAAFQYCSLHETLPLVFPSVLYCV